jgi:hypothetical protein
MQSRRSQVVADEVTKTIQRDPSLRLHVYPEHVDAARGREMPSITTMFDSSQSPITFLLLFFSIGLASLFSRVPTPGR